MRPTGHIPDLFRSNDSVVSATAQEVDDRDSDTRLDDVISKDYDRDQANESSCVGQVAAQQPEAQAAFEYYILGTRKLLLTRLSSLWPYAGGRQKGDPEAALVDVGSRPRDVFEFVLKHGLVAETRWKAGSGDVTVNTPVSLDLFQHGFDAKMTSYARVYGSSLDLLRNIAACISLGSPVGQAMPVDDSFDDPPTDGKTSIGTLRGSLRGSHYTMLTGWRRSTDYTGFDFLLKNSWGPSYGFNGRVWITGGRLIQCASDFWRSVVAPEGVS